jgi:hypothetical protein
MLRVESRSRSIRREPDHFKMEGEMSRLIPQGGTATNKEKTKTNPLTC